jgi:hypothetical protein
MGVQYGSPSYYLTLYYGIVSEEEGVWLAESRPWLLLPFQRVNELRLFILVHCYHYNMQLWSTPIAGRVLMTGLDGVTLDGD